MLGYQGLIYKHIRSIKEIPGWDIPSLSDRGSPNDNASTDQQNKDPSIVQTGAALLPISTKFHKQIEQGNFIEMAELLPESLGHLIGSFD